MARPTMSKVLYTRQLRRGMRLSACIRRTYSQNKSAQILSRFAKLEAFLKEEIAVQFSLLGLFRAYRDARQTDRFKSDITSANRLVRI